VHAIETPKGGRTHCGKMETIMDLRISTEVTFICEVMLLRISTLLSRVVLICRNAPYPHEEYFAMYAENVSSREV